MKYHVTVSIIGVWGADVEAPDPEAAWHRAYSDMIDEGAIGNIMLAHAEPALIFDEDGKLVGGTERDEYEEDERNDTRKLLEDNE